MCIGHGKSREHFVVSLLVSAIAREVFALDSSLLQSGKNRAHESSDGSTNGFVS